ncbi:MAG: DUF1080 domain-containing protein [archaeon]|nr:DUF1080 domain-containing protein [archaeon]
MLVRNLFIVLFLLFFFNSVIASSLYQPVAIDKFVLTKGGNLIPWLTGSNYFQYDGIDFVGEQNALMLINDQVISDEERGWVPPTNFQEQDLNNFFPTDYVYFTSGLSWGTAIPQATTVALMRITDENGIVHEYPIRAGIETAEWSLNANPNHSRPEHVLGPYPFWNGYEYLARIPLNSVFTPKHISVEYVNFGPNSGAIGISAISFNRTPTLPSNELLYSENFDDGIADNWIPEDGDWIVENGVYKQREVINDERTTKISPNPNWKNFSLQLDARRTGGNAGYHIFFRVNGQAQENNYVITISEYNLIGLGRGQNYQWLGNLQLVPNDYDINQWHRIKLIADGNHFELFFDGNKIIDTFDPDNLFSTGTVGLGLYAAAGEFDNIEITSPNMVNSFPIKLFWENFSWNANEQNGGQIILNPNTNELAFFGTAQSSYWNSFAYIQKRFPNLSTAEVELRSEPLIGSANAASLWLVQDENNAIIVEKHRDIQDPQYNSNLVVFERINGINYPVFVHPDIPSSSFDKFKIQKTFNGYKVFYNNNLVYTGSYQLTGTLKVRLSGWMRQTNDQIFSEFRNFKVTYNPVIDKEVAIREFG